MPKTNNGWDKYIENLAVYIFDADYHWMILDNDYCKLVIEIIEENMNKKFEIYLNG